MWTLRDSRLALRDLQHFLSFLHHHTRKIDRYVQAARMRAQSALRPASRHRHRGLQQTFPRVSSRRHCFLCDSLEILGEKAANMWARFSVVLRTPWLATGVSATSGPKRPGSVPRRVSGALRAPRSGGSKKCPESVPEVSRRCPGHSKDTLGTFWDTPEPGKGPRIHSEGHSWDTSGSKGPTTVVLRWLRRMTHTNLSPNFKESITPFSKPGTREISLSSFFDPPRFRS